MSTRNRQGGVAALVVAGCLLLACADDAQPETSAALEATGDAAASPPATPLPTVEPVTRLLFTGDIIPARCTYARLRDGGSYDAAFDALRPLLTGADLTIGTLDSTLGQSSSPIGCVETLNLAGPPAFAGALRRAGFDVIAHAANHSKDCGDAACGDASMFETIWNLRSAGIEAVGSGGDVAAARAPVVVERNGVRFAFLAYDDIGPWYHATESTAGTAPLDLTTVAEDIVAARAIADVVVVVPHWGIEYTADPSERQREAARIMAEAGADLVIGNHAHWVQAHERIGGMFVAYALGNFVFDQDWSLETQQGAMLEVTFTGTRVTATRYMPVHVWDEYQPRLAEPDEAWQILERIEAASEALTP